MTKPAKTWWGRKLIETLEIFTESERLSRGRRYLAGRRISHWQIRGHRVDARIRGRISPYYGVHEEPVYETWVEFVPIADSTWNEVILRLGESAGFVSRLLFNEMPDEIEKPLAAFGLSLLPRGRNDLDSHCSCPDLDPPCKHVAGLYHLLAARLDQDPFLLFELRGLSRTELFRKLKTTPLGSVLTSALSEDPGELHPVHSYFTRPEPLPLPVTVCPKDFWRGAKRLPAGVEPPQPTAISGILIRKGGDYPPFWVQDESFVEIMDLLYEQVRKKATDWA